MGTVRLCVCSYLKDEDHRNPVQTNENNLCIGPSNSWTNRYNPGVRTHDPAKATLPIWQCLLELEPYVLPFPEG